VSAGFVEVILALYGLQKNNNMNQMEKKSTDATYLIRPMKSDPDHLLKK
jgi:hypothetical protein